MYAGTLQLISILELSGSGSPVTDCLPLAGIASACKPTPNQAQFLAAHQVQLILVRDFFLRS
jgi:hypothetical protein